MKTARILLLASVSCVLIVLSNCSSTTTNHEQTSSETLTEVVEKLREGDGWSTWGPTLPIQLESKSTRLNLKDYLLYGENVDSVVYFHEMNHPERIHFNSYNDAIITKQPTNGIGLLSIYVKQGSNSAQRNILVFASEMQEITIETNGGRISEATSVHLAGSMNGWSSWKTPLEQVENGNWSVTLNLPLGNHSYQIITDNAWGLDPANNDSIPQWARRLEFTDRSIPSFIAPCY